MRQAMIALCVSPDAGPAVSAQLNLTDSDPTVHVRCCNCGVYYAVCLTNKTMTIMTKY